MATTKRRDVLDAGDTSPTAIDVPKDWGQREAAASVSLREKAAAGLLEAVGTEMWRAYKGKKVVDYEKEVHQAIEDFDIRDVNSPNKSLYQSDTQATAKAVVAGTAAETLGGMRDELASMPEEQRTAAMQTGSAFKQGQMAKFSEEGKTALEAIKQGILTSEEGRVRMESILKRHIAANPQFADDFRRVSRRLTGTDDWDSYSIRKALAEQKLEKANTAATDAMWAKQVEMFYETDGPAKAPTGQIVPPPHLYEAVRNGNVYAQQLVMAHNQYVNGSKAAVAEGERQAKIHGNDQASKLRGISGKVSTLLNDGKSALQATIAAQVSDDRELAALLKNPAEWEAARASGKVKTRLGMAVDGYVLRQETAIRETMAAAGIGLDTKEGKEYYDAQLATVKEHAELMLSHNMSYNIIKSVYETTKDHAAQEKARTDQIIAMHTAFPGASGLFEQWLADPTGFRKLGDSPDAKQNYADIATSFEKMMDAVATGYVGPVGGGVRLSSHRREVDSTGIPVRFKDDVRALLEGRQLMVDDIISQNARLHVASMGKMYYDTLAAGREVQGVDPVIQRAALLSFARDATIPNSAAQKMLSGSLGSLQKVLDGITDEATKQDFSTMVVAQAGNSLTSVAPGRLMERTVSLLVNDDYRGLEAAYDPIKGIHFKYKEGFLEDPANRNVPVGGVLSGNLATPSQASGIINRLRPTLLLMSDPRVLKNSVIKFDPHAVQQDLVDTINANVEARRANPKAPLVAPASAQLFPASAIPSIPNLRTASAAPMGEGTSGGVAGGFEDWVAVNRGDAATSAAVGHVGMGFEPQDTGKPMQWISEKWPSLEKKPKSK